MNIRYPTNLPWLESHLIVLRLAGSHSYGMATPQSDEDFVGVVLPPAEFLISVTNDFNTFSSTGKEDTDDVTIHAFDKFFKQAMKSRASALELLFDEAPPLVTSPFWERMVAERDIFLSKAAKHSYCGYAHAQVLRIEREERLHGTYNTKQASHVVRLLHSCRELLRDSTIHVNRSGIDGELLLDIRNGAWPVDRLVEYKEEVEAEIDELYETSDLPYKPDLDRIDDLYRELVLARINKEYDS